MRTKTPYTHINTVVVERVTIPEDKYVQTMTVVIANATTSRMSAPLQGTLSAAIITAPETTPPTNMAAPVNAPRLSTYPFSSSDVMADIVADTSAAPFPSANKVTPANRGGSPSLTEKNSRLQEK